MGVTLVDGKPETNHVGSYSGHQRYVDAICSDIKFRGTNVGAPNATIAIDVSVVHPLAESNSTATAQDELRAPELRH
jgi:hypothetical protein